MTTCKPCSLRVQVPPSLRVQCPSHAFPARLASEWTSQAAECAMSLRLQPGDMLVQGWSSGRASWRKGL